MTVSFKIVACILLVKCTGFVSCGFTYDDDYAEINKDNYGFDLSEERHVSAEQPKYNTMIRGYRHRGPPMPVVAEDLAMTGGDCDVEKYIKYFWPIHVLMTNATAGSNAVADIRRLEGDFMDNHTLGLFNWTEVCYHRVNSLYCSSTIPNATTGPGTCECLEVKLTGYEGLIKAKDDSYDPYTLRHYKHCRIRNKYGCDPSHSTKVLKCDDGLFCSKIGECMPSSSEQNRNLLGFTTMLIFTSFWVCKVIPVT